AVMKLKNMQKVNDQKSAHQPSILCFVGPPGVGKTSLGRSIARSLGRKFIKVSLGGIRDEAEIRGHRRTYVGALPGRMIQGIKQSGTNNPVFMLDEIDKVGRDYRGDPSSALLEALDPEQNHAFSDHYLEVPFDLSGVFFITTANILDTIPDALLDRLEVIHFAGYTEDEKFNIAKNYLIPKQKSAHHIEAEKVRFTDESLRTIIRRFTREAGVRELERQIATVFRKVAREIVEKKSNGALKSIVKSDVQKYLGPYKYSAQMIEEHNTIGITTGLAWTHAGGDILFIEVATMPGKGNLTLTGNLGDVMKESCQAALSYIRARWDMFKMEKDFFANSDIHVHVPEGAVPKDGPSAGTAIVTSMVSALTKIPVKRDVAMTGEITLRGRVTEIGGLKEKVIAAHRAGIKTVIIPRDNKKDLVDIPKKVQEDLKFIFADHIDEVLREALVFPNGKKEFVARPQLMIEKEPEKEKKVN
ncbi:endopeptidase La, partial [Candidatus Roizmanbacteria bacterium RIFCSPHIGHO2_12_FULL_38_13]